MMNEIRFWDKNDDNIMFKGVYTHRVDENEVDTYIQANAKEAIEKGATSITVNTEYGIEDYSIYIFDDKVEIVLISIEKWDNDDYDDYTGNMSCDNTGFCSGWGCPNFAKCKG